MAVNKDKMLALWYPFTKDWTNQGVDNSALLSSSNATIVSGGKLGKCLQLTGVGNVATFNSLKNLNKFTIALWIRNDATSGYGDWADIILLSCNHMNGYMNRTENGIFRIERHNSTNTTSYTCYFNHYLNGTNTSTGAATYTGTSAGTTIALNEWKHIVMTFDGSVGKVYFNGGAPATINFTDRKSTNYKLNGNVVIGAESNSKSSINDFRIYTYALSDQEVKELAKGKVCHYPLDDLDFKMPNLCTNTSFDNTTGWFSVNDSTLSTTTLDGFKCLTATKGSRNNLFGTGNYLYYTAGNTDIYSVTMRVYSSVTLTFGGSCMLTTSSASGWQSFTLKTIESSGFSLKVGWNTIKWVFSVYHASYSRFLNIYFSASGTTYKITNVNIQKYNLTSNNICYDISGNHYDLTPTGNISLSNDTKRYKYSCNCTINASSYFTSPNIGISTTNTTLSFWYKRTAASSGSESLLNAGGLLLIWFRDGQWSPRVRAYKSGDSSVYLGETSFANASTANTNWCHCAAVVNGKSLKLYYNGTPLTEQTTTNDISNTLTTFLLAVAKILISDFRIYATALSEADIKELYALGN